jgi:WS/DGAT/MGAT family acyltransferase
MWNMEKDPAFNSWFASVTILDKPVDIDRLRPKMAQAASEIPRLRQSVMPGVCGLTPPEWVLDPDFDLEYHLRRISLPAPGSPRDLYDYVAKALIDPFERTRPLWQFTVIEGLEGGGAALFQKMHHTITDGEGGARLSLKFIEMSRDEPAAEMPAFDREEHARDFATAATWTLGHNARRIVGIGARAANAIVTNPAGTARNLVRLAQDIAKVLGETGGGGTGGVGSTVWTSRGLKRWYDTISLPFDDVKATSKRLGGTINDVFLAGVVSGIASYHEEKGEAPSGFRGVVPVSTRSDNSAGGNQFGGAMHDFPASTDPFKTFAGVQEVMGRVKRGEGSDLMGSLALIVNMLPTSIVLDMAKSQTSRTDFCASNVRGAPFATYVSGAMAEHNFAMGPLVGAAFNITAFSYNGFFDMGLHVDATAIEDPENLHRCIRDSFAVLLTP